MRYLAIQKSQDDEILLDCMRECPLQDNTVVQNTRKKYTYIYCIIQRCNLINIPIGLTFKTAFYGENGVINFKFDSEYYGDPIPRKQHKTNQQIK